MNKLVFVMKRIILVMLLFILCGFLFVSFVLSEFEVEDFVDLIVVFVYLKNDCGYNELFNNEIKWVIVYFV